MVTTPSCTVIRFNNALINTQRLEHCVHARVIELSNNRIIISLLPCALHCVQTRIYIYRWVSPEPQMTERFLLICFLQDLYIYLYICTHSRHAYRNCDHYNHSYFVVNFFFFFLERIHILLPVVRKKNKLLTTSQVSTTYLHFPYISSRIFYRRQYFIISVHLYTRKNYQWHSKQLFGLILDMTKNLITTYNIDERREGRR